MRFFENFYFLLTYDSNYLNVDWMYDSLIFRPVFIYTLITSIAITVIYYNLINNLIGGLGYLRYWFVFLFITGIIGFFIAYTKVSNIIYPGVEILSDGIIYSFMNAFYSMLFYSVFSLIFKTKKISIYANHLPFKTPW